MIAIKKKVSSESIMSSNDTLRNFPEISLFLKEIFLKTPGINVSTYENISFSAEWAYNLFNHTSSDHEWLKNYDVLLHVGNLDFLFKTGETFESSNSLNDLEPIRVRFHLDSLEQTHVFYSYLKYMVDEFGSQKSQNGTSGHAFMASIISLEMLKLYNSMTNYLLPELVSNLIAYNANQKNISCEFLFTSSGFNESVSQNICQNNKILNEDKRFNAKSVKFLLEICEIRNGKAWKNFSSSANLSKIDLMIFCESINPNETSFSFLKAIAETRIYSFYNCSINNFSCTKQEISRKQWGNSSISQNPLPELLSFSEQFKSTLTVHDWNPILFPKSFEYISVLFSHRNFSSNKNIVGFNETISKKLLSFDRLFSQAIRYVFTDYEKNDHIKIQQFFYAEDTKAFQNYLKYIMIEIGLQGFVSSRTIEELLWGYQDPLLSIALTTNPIMGGDPSINPIVSLVVNSTYEQALNSSQSVYSGKGDVSKTRVYSNVYDLDYVTYKDAAFDGNRTFDVYINPWKENIKYEGSDSFCNPPGLDTGSKIKIYMTDVCYGGVAEFSEHKEHNGLDTLRFVTTQSFMQNKTNTPLFEKYHMDRWNQALNMTSIKKMPIFLTKFRYLDLDSEPTQELDIFTNESKTEKVKPDEQYQIHMDVEPYTGGSISASLNIHTSFEYQSDELFSNQKYVFLPILGVIRPGTWSAAAVNINKFMNILLNYIIFRLILFMEI